MLNSLAAPKRSKSKKMTSQCKPIRGQTSSQSQIDALYNTLLKGQTLGKPPNEKEEANYKPKYKYPLSKGTGGSKKRRSKKRLTKRFIKKTFRKRTRRNKRMTNK